jgi:hypothetical protein
MWVVIFIALLPILVVLRAADKDAKRKHRGKYRRK